MGPLARLFSTAWRVVGGMLGRSFREWSEWAASSPVAAAYELDLIASTLEGRAKAYRNPQGWRARRDRGIASSLRHQARALRSAADERYIAAACAVVPGTMAVPGADAVRSRA